MVNGMPGPMAVETAKACLDRGFNLLPLGFTGPSGKTKSIKVEGETTSVTVELTKGPGISEEGRVCEASERLAALKSQYPDLVIIDYTNPSAALKNLQCYVENDCDFVMGTTGEDFSVLQTSFYKKNPAGTPGCMAVIAPNMAKQIVAVQATLLDMAKRFPGSFVNYDLEVVESHQSTKADTSGTAKAIVTHLSTLNGGDYHANIDKIVKIRNKDQQIQFGVPESFLSGHAFHTYTLKSKDGSVHFELKHNVCGRRVYAEGTADAVEFLRKVRSEGGDASLKRLFNMIDVLESGQML